MNNKQFPGLNVLSNDSRETLNNNIMNTDVIDAVANMINTSGKNRAQRRRLEKGLARTNKLSEKAQKKLDYSLYHEYKAVTDKDFVHFNAILALVMFEDYRWIETEENDHGQITSLLERVQKKMLKYKDKNFSTEDICREVYKKTGIMLYSDIESNKIGKETYEE